MNLTSEKDFNRYIDLLDQHIERVVSAGKAAHQYMKPNSVLLSKGLVMYSGLLNDSDQLLLASEIMNTRPSDAKRKDSIAVNVGGISQIILPTIIKLVLSHFRSRLDEVKAEMYLNTYRQHLTIAPGDDDIQAVLHRDTFFPAFKYWYFPMDVTAGAFIYAEYSAELSDQRLKWEEEQVDMIRSGVVESWRGIGHAQGSFRTNDQELTEMGLTAAPVNVPADTLVVVNVFGFHARGAVEAPADRLALSGSIRFKRPFEI